VLMCSLMLHEDVAMKYTAFLNAAASRSNICNKGRRGAGVQLEITKALRDDFMQGARLRKLTDFADAVANAIAGVSDQLGAWGGRTAAPPGRRFLTTSTPGGDCAGGGDTKPK
jgi:Poly-gamma-glutamate hydrolase